MTVEQIKRKIEVGDYILASKLLNITPENVRARFSREKMDAIEALKAIISNRERFIKEYHKKISG
ncbi:MULTISPECIES: hypothetical protein [Apibacter]|nr:MULTISPECIES: hypothetical protein [Apibacter]MCX8677317.1 hypothetical protein [Apibacter sp. B3919]MXO25553.1 hypothetical protein [Apibacter sp. B3924]MXO26792.1 hypothetical protein [Apibacter sp. B3813]MXO28638.1 hypothetical protein [Apibacter sp. B3913]MXO30592.1 hypothetical protein [Apibacter sp. B3912]